MSDETYDELISLTGQTASIDGSTQLRAGVVRPEVIIPLADGEEVSEAPLLPDVLTPGMRVMVVREPGFGVTGRVKSLSSRPTPVESGALTALAVVIADGDGRELQVPQSNLKVLAGVSQ